MSEPLKILMMQKNACCIRNYKFARVLKERGHEVGLFTDGQTPQQCYSKNNLLKDEDAYTRVHRVPLFSDYFELVKVIKEHGYQILHAHNEPDSYALLAQANPFGLPMIHNCHDIVSATWRIDMFKEAEKNDLMSLESLALKRSDSIIFPAEGLIDIAKDKYGEIAENQGVFWSTPVKSFIPKDEELLPKLSEKDGKIHIVYAGGFNITANVNGVVPERFYMNFFLDLLRYANDDVMIHVYTPGMSDDILSHLMPFKKDGLIYEGSVDPSDLIKALSQYDYGFFGNCSPTPGLNYINALPNKMFEYFSAGLPMISDESVISVVKFSEKHPDYAKIYKTAADCYKLLKEGMGAPSIDRFKFVFDDYGEELENFHRRLMGESATEEVSDAGEQNE